MDGKKLPLKYTEHKNLNYPELGRSIQQFWKEHRVFERSVEEREGQPSFTFFEGPPSANGTPGIHHVMARTVKDIFCRYKTQQGFQVKRKGGWDTHGLPVELQVEKALGITKDDIGKKISVEAYNQACREAVMKYTHEWNDVTERMGYWVDLNDPYVTYHSDYIESVWSLLKRLYNKGLLYEGYTIQPYSPAAGTGLSSHELNQPGTYKMVKDTTVVAQFRIKAQGAGLKVHENPEEAVYFLAWTTTPWTLPANSALAVGEKIRYAKVRTYNPYTHLPVSVILAEDLIPRFFSDKGKDGDLSTYQPGDKLIPWQVAGSWLGSELLGIDYEQLMPYVQPEERAFYVIPGDFVSTEDGTGIVHISPTFGADDFRVAKQAGVPAILVKDEDGNWAPLVNKKGQLVAEVTDFAGRYVKNYTDEDESAADYRSTDVLIAIKLKEENKAFRVEKYEHTYPHCWRTDKPVLYYPMESWFVKTTAYKEQLVALNQTINWKPASTGSGRFGNWLENLVDWNLSRSRYWGTPLPIWRSADTKTEICIGSLAELAQEVETAQASGLLNAEQLSGNQAFLTAYAAGNTDLHRPYVDRIYLVKDGQVLTRETDLVDVWFDSGAMPYAQWHWPFENEGTFRANFPADFIAEGVDQTRGWFFTLHALAVMLEDSVAFKNVIANGLVLDKDGNKMSKRLGNAIDPIATIDDWGPDAVRWYMISNSAPWDNLKFNIDGVKEVQRKFFGTLANTYAFFALYANLDGFRYEEEEIPLAQRTESDRWILSRLNHLTQDVREALDEYEPTRAARAIQDFVNEDLSNWYVRLNRKRFWKGEYNADKIAAFQTLYSCLETLAGLIAPIAPFYAEHLYQDLNKVSGRKTWASIHLGQFPQADTSVLNPGLERRMELAQKIASLVHSVRKGHKLKVRQPLSRILIPVLNPEDKIHIQAVEDLILSEVNIKHIEYIEDTTGIVTKKVKPNFARLGKALGPKMKDLQALLAAFSQEDIARLEKEGQLSLTLGGEAHTLVLADFDISSEDIPGWIVASEGGITVALDVTLNEDLVREGLARELVNRIQNIRKDMDLEITSKIRVNLEKNEAVDWTPVLASFGEYIQTETQALALQVLDRVEEGIALDMDDFELKIQVQAL